MELGTTLLTADVPQVYSVMSIMWRCVHIVWPCTKKDSILLFTHTNPLYIRIILLMVHDQCLVQSHKHTHSNLLTISLFLYKLWMNIPQAWRWTNWAPLCASGWTVEPPLLLWRMQVNFYPIDFLPGQNTRLKQIKQTSAVEKELKKQWGSEAEAVLTIDVFVGRKYKLLSYGVQNTPVLFLSFQTHCMSYTKPDFRSAHNFCP